VRLAELGVDRDLSTVVVLGAGASRGAACVRQTGVAPPLDADFFAQAQRMPAAALSKKDRDLFTFVRDEFGQGQAPTLEVFFTQMSAVDRFHHDFNIRGRPSGKFGRQLVALRSLIPRVLGEALGGRDCKWHRRIASALRANDAVMSFNYDTLMDRALRSEGANRWDPAVGYGFPVANGADLWAPAPAPGPKVRYPVRLLKPHGSLNWSLNSEGVTLVDEYSAATAESIVPPTWDKSDVTQWPWSQVWKSAREVLGPARMLVVVGYSVPVTDQLSQALLRADVNRLDALVVVNPDGPSRGRAIDLLSSALSRDSLVVELDSLAEFASYLPLAASEPRPVDLARELARIRTRLKNFNERLDEISSSQGDLESQLEDTVSDIEDMQIRLDDLGQAADNDDLLRVKSDVADLDARLDSILQDR
jgi:hypothetical protein